MYQSCLCIVITRLWLLVLPACHGQLNQAAQQPAQNGGFSTQFPASPQQQQPASNQGPQQQNQQTQPSFNNFPPGPAQQQQPGFPPNLFNTNVQRPNSLNFPPNSPQVQQPQQQGEQSQQPQIQQQNQQQNQQQPASNQFNGQAPTNHPSLSTHTQNSTPPVDKNVDLDGDGALSLAEVQYAAFVHHGLSSSVVENLFNEVDKNKDGYLTSIEFNEIRPLVLAKAENAALRYLQSVDTDHNGLLSLEEAQNYILKEYGISNRDVERIWRLTVPSSSDEMDAVLFSKLRRRIRGMSIRLARQIMKIADKNEDGHIDLKEAQMIAFEQEGIGAGDVIEMSAGVDDNNDGELNAPEFADFQRIVRARAVETSKKALKVVDTDGSDSITMNEAKQIAFDHYGFEESTLEPFFAQADENEDGQLDAVEFAGFRSVIRSRAVKNALNILPDVDEDADQDRSGSLDKVELADFVRLVRLSAIKYVNDHFREYDKNRDKLVTIDELEQIVKDRYHVEPATTKKFFDRVDVDRSGDLNAGEIVDFRHEIRRHVSDRNVQAELEVQNRREMAEIEAKLRSEAEEKKQTETRKSSGKTEGSQENSDDDTNSQEDRLENAQSPASAKKAASEAKPDSANASKPLKHRDENPSTDKAAAAVDRNDEQLALGSSNSGQTPTSNSQEEEQDDAAEQQPSDSPSEDTAVSTPQQQATSEVDSGEQAEEAPASESESPAEQTTPQPPFTITSTQASTTTTQEETTTPEQASEEPQTIPPPKKKARKSHRKKTTTPAMVREPETTSSTHESNISSVSSPETTTTTAPPPISTTTSQEPSSSVQQTSTNQASSLATETSPSTAMPESIELASSISATTPKEVVTETGSTIAPISTTSLPEQQPSTTSKAVKKKRRKQKTTTTTTTTTPAYDDEEEEEEISQETSEHPPAKH
uniref:EF-hand domain-containing protein n=1 Tax=Ditylenchus dipsaci TaxID=166011 RepID=A0A915CZT3_9BILA